MNMTGIPATVLGLSLLFAAEAPKELGTVRFERDLDAALAAAKASGKPVFLLFQEVPG